MVKWAGKENGLSIKYFDKKSEVEESGEFVKYVVFHAKL